MILDKSCKKKLPKEIEIYYTFDLYSLGANDNLLKKNELNASKDISINIETKEFSKDVKHRSKMLVVTTKFW